MLRKHISIFNYHFYEAKKNPCSRSHSLCSLDSLDIESLDADKRPLPD